MIEGQTRHWRGITVNKNLHQLVVIKQTDEIHVAPISIDPSEFGLHRINNATS